MLHDAERKTTKTPAQPIVRIKIVEHKKWKLIHTILDYLLTIFTLNVCLIYMKQNNKSSRRQTRPNATSHWLAGEGKLYADL